MICLGQRITENDLMDAVIENAKFFAMLFLHIAFFVVYYIVVAIAVLVIAAMWKLSDNKIPKRHRAPT